jgi:crotonobetainyl-CoA:carnitine CoA-transferase CaiB-like acyl-CoA transferase
MAALFDRERTGEGQLIDVSLLATSVTFMTPFLMERQLTGIFRTRQGNTGYYAAPSDAFRTRDGWINVPTIGDSMFRRWARLVGREEMIDDARFNDDITRAGNAELIGEVMSAWCAARTRDEAIRELERARIPCGPVYDLDEVLADEQVRARRLFEETSFSGEPVRVSSPAARLSRSPGEVRRAAPKLGEHTDEILSELGFTADRIADFRSQGVI